MARPDGVFPRGEEAVEAGAPFPVLGQGELVDRLLGKIAKLEEALAAQRAPLRAASPGGAAAGEQPRLIKAGWGAYAMKGRGQ